MPTLGEHPDLRCEIEGIVFLFECKRLFSASTDALRKRIQQAGNQLHKIRSRLATGVCGIVAISLSTLFNPEYKSLPIADQLVGRAVLASCLTDQARLVSDLWPSLLQERVAVGSYFTRLPIHQF